MRIAADDDDDDDYENRDGAVMLMSVARVVEVTLTVILSESTGGHVALRLNTVRISMIGLNKMMLIMSTMSRMMPVAITQIMVLGGMMIELSLSPALPVCSLGLSNSNHGHEVSSVWV